MDFKRTWTPFALEAEYEHFGTFRFVKAHNERVSELELQLITAQEQIIALKHSMSDLKAFVFNVNPYRIEPKNTLEEECEELEVAIKRLRQENKILREGLEKYSDTGNWAYTEMNTPCRNLWMRRESGYDVATATLKAAEEVK